MVVRCLECERETYKRLYIYIYDVRAFEIEREIKKRDIGD